MGREGWSLERVLSTLSSSGCLGNPRACGNPFQQRDADVQLLRSWLEAASSQYLSAVTNSSWSERTAPFASFPSDRTWYISDASLLVDKFGDWQEPMVPSDAAATGILTLSVGQSSLSSNTVHFTDPRPQASVIVLPPWMQATHISRVLDLEEGGLVLAPGHVRSFLPVNRDDVPRTYIRFHVSIAQDVAKKTSLSAAHPTAHGPASDCRSVPLANITPHLSTFWPTQVGIVQLFGHGAAATLTELSSTLTGMAAQLGWRSEHKSNKGGWQSTANLFEGERVPEPMVVLRTKIYHAVFQYLSTAPSPSIFSEDVRLGSLEIDIHASWGCINRRLDFNSPHFHPDSSVSGAFYVSAGGLPETAISFLDPRARSRTEGDSLAFGPDRKVVRVSPGTLVLFPSWLEHFVPPHQGPEDRIVVSFNARVRHRSSGDAQSLSLKVPRRHLHGFS